MPERTNDAIARLTAWIRDYGDQKEPVFIEDLKAVLAEAERLRETNRRLERDLDAALTVMANHDLSLGDIVTMPLKQDAKILQLQGEVDRLTAELATLKAAKPVTYTEGGEFVPMPYDLDE